MENSNIPSADETVKIYNSKNNEVQLKFHHGPMKQLLFYEQNPSKRVDSRRFAPLLIKAVARAPVPATKILKFAVPVVFKI